MLTAGERGGTFCSFFTVPPALRFDAAGIRDITFNPGFFTPGGGNADVAFAVRPDGRLLYGASLAQMNAAALQQTLPNGAPDSSFGNGGKVTFALAVGEGSRAADLVVLPDGSAVFAVLTPQRLVLFKVDAQGVPVTGSDPADNLPIPATLTVPRVTRGRFLCTRCETDRCW